MEGPLHSYRDSMIRRYGVKTYKLTVSGGRSCPTRDGTYGPKKGWGGCAFCDVYGSASYFSNLRKMEPVTEQLSAMVGPIRERFKAEKFVAYFQSYTTTHQEIEEYRPRYEEAVAFPGVVRLAVGTRPDCLPDSVLELLGGFLDRVDVQLELGVQSLQDEVLEWFDRGHDAACAIDGLRRALAYSAQKKAEGCAHEFDVSAHLILGAPQEKEEDLVRLANTLNELGVHGVKIHNLHVLKRTKLAARYQRGEFKVPEMAEYFTRVGFFLRHLKPEIVVHRIHGLASHKEDLVAPEWSAWKTFPSEQFSKWMREQGFRQGDLLRGGIHHG